LQGGRSYPAECVNGLGRHHTEVLRKMFNGTFRHPVEKRHAFVGGSEFRGLKAMVNRPTFACRPVFGRKYQIPPYRAPDSSNHGIRSEPRPPAVLVQMNPGIDK
jgi:hypothetical protein